MESDTNPPQQNPTNTPVPEPTATEAAQIEQNVPPPPAKPPSQKYKIVALVIIIFTLIITGLAIYAVGFKNRQPSSPADQVIMRKDKILVRARKTENKTGAELYWTDLTGSAPVALDVELAKELHESFVLTFPPQLSPDVSSILFTMQPSSGYVEFIEKLKESIKTGEILEQFVQTYKYVIANTDGNIIATLDTGEVESQIGNSDSVLFTGWATDEKLFFMTSSSSSDQLKKLILGTYNYKTKEIKELVRESAQYLQWPSLSSDGKWLKYTKSNGVLQDSVNILHNLETKESQVVGFKGSFYNQKHDNWVGYQEYETRNKLYIWSIQSPSSPTASTNPLLHENSAYDITSITWAPNGSMFAITSRPLQSAYDEENILNIHIYSRSGEEMCKLSVDPGRVPYQESYSDLLFSQDNEKLLVVSVEDSKFFKGPNLWQTFDTKSCNVDSVKKEMPIELNKPIFWFTSS